MKRIFTLTISLVLAMVFCFTMLTGCTLIHTDAKKDMNQVVATIKISDDIETATVYKRDVILAYINQYYVYEQNYGYTREQVFDLIVSEIIETKVVVQAAMLYFAQDKVVTDWSVKSFLGEDEIYQAKYNAYKSIDDLIDSYSDEVEEEKVQDSYVGEKRVVPTGAVNDEEITIYDKKDYVRDCEANGIEVASRRKAFNNTIKSLKNNELLGDEYDGKDITKTDYFKNILNSYYEQELLTKYERALSSDIRNETNYEKLEEHYNEIYQKQKAWNITEFKDALANLSADTDPIVYTGEQANGYGKVYHILLAADEETKQLVEDWKTANPNHKSEDLENAMYQIYFENIKVYDKRTSWIMQGFDFDGTYFTGKYSRLDGHDHAEAFPYLGTVKEISEEGAEEKEYFAEITDANKMTVNQFLAKVDAYLYNKTEHQEEGTDYSKKNYHAVTSIPENRVTFEHKIEELMFAFSDDDSETALNSYKGYVISPDNAEGWSPAFWEGGKELIAGNYLDYGYVIKATEHGLHVMFLSEKYGDGYNYKTLDAYLDHDFAHDFKYTWEVYLEGSSDGAIVGMLQNWYNWEETNNYLYKAVNSLTSNAITAHLESKNAETIKQYINNGSFVQRFDEVYKDLI